MDIDLDAFKWAGPLTYTKKMIAENEKINNNQDENDITVDANADADPLDMGIPPPIEVVSVIGRATSRRGRPKTNEAVEKEFICDICNAKFNKK